MGGRDLRGGGGGERGEALRQIFEAPVELAITPREAEIVILEKDGRLRTLHPDSKAYKTEGGRAEQKTLWEGGKLIVDTKNAMGPRITETFGVTSDRTRMTMTVRLDGAAGPTLTFKRVYEPAEATPGETPQDAGL